MTGRWVAALAVLSLGSPAIAQLPQPVENDLRCVAVLSAATAVTPEGEQRMQLAVGVMYFVGHVEGISPGIDLKAQLRRVVTTLRQEDMASEGQRCGAILVQKGNALQQMGAELAAEDNEAPQ